jgi:hypothetical protein
LIHKGSSGAEQPEGHPKIYFRAIERSEKCYRSIERQKRPINPPIDARDQLIG